MPLKAARRRLGAREREIDLHPDLVAMLKRHKAEQFEKGIAGAGDSVAYRPGQAALLPQRPARLGNAADKAGLNEGDEPRCRLTISDTRRSPLDRSRARRGPPLPGWRATPSR